MLGDRRILERAAPWVGAAELEYELVEDPAGGHYRAGSVTLLDMANAAPEDCPIGQVSAAAGRAAVEYVFRACDLAMAGEVDAVVTAPLNKAAMNLAGFDYAGHTELLTERTGATRVQHAAGRPAAAHRARQHPCRAGRGHPARHAASGSLATIELAQRSCRALGIAAPRIAVAGLNPHAGEGGLFGDEEERAIVPAIAAARARGWTSPTRSRPTRSFCARPRATSTSWWRCTTIRATSR